jgi:hypothetical protein
MAGSFYDAIIILTGQPQNYAGEIIIYTLVAIMLLWILELLMNLVFLLIRKV